MTGLAMFDCFLTLFARRKKGTFFNLLYNFHFSYTKTSILNDLNMCDALRYLVPFVQFKKREKHPCRSVNFIKIAG